VNNVRVVICLKLAQLCVIISHFTLKVEYYIENTKKRTKVRFFDIRFIQINWGDRRPYLINIHSIIH
jgi:hypothetical protein